MANVVIKSDGRRMDYETASALPLSLKKRTDKFLSFVGADGITIDNAAKSIALPATKPNQLVVGSAHNPAKKKEKIIDFNIDVDGTNVFCGDARVKNANKGCRFPNSYQIELYGDGASLWKKLEGKSLRELDIGTEIWLPESVVSSWTETYDDGRCGVFAPVLYGKVLGAVGAPFGQTKPAFSLADFKLNVYYKCIFDAIAKLCGYSIKSEFMETELFKETVYMWGVTDFTYGSGIVSSNCYVEAYHETSQTITNGAVRFLDNVVQNNCTEWNDNSVQVNAGTTMTASQSGGYDIDFCIETDKEADSVDIQVVGSTLSQTITGVKLTNGRWQYCGTWRVGISAGSQIQIIINNNNAVEVYGGYFKSSSERAYSPLFDLNVSSTLHDNKIKDFIRGVSHQFDLAWYVDAACKQICVEPRFDYVIKDRDGNKQSYKGFYHSIHRHILQPSDEHGETKPQELCMDCSEIKLKFVCPFGDYIKNGYGRDEDDGLANYYNEQNEEDVPVYGTKTELCTDTGKNTDSLNPYFTELYQYTDPLIPATSLPMIVGSDWEFGTTLPEHSFETAPKSALVYRGNATVLSDGMGGIIPLGETDVPWLSQQAIFGSPNGQPLEKCYSISYSDVVAQENDGEGVVINGLISTFYIQYLATIREGEVLTANFIIDNCFVSQEHFRRLKSFAICGNIEYWILLCISKFEPARICPTELEMIKLVCPTTEDVEQTTHYKIES